MGPAHACYAWGRTAPDGGWIDGDTVHRAHLTALDSAFGRVLTTAEILDAERRIPAWPCIGESPADAAVSLNAQS